MQDLGHGLPPDGMDGPDTTPNERYGAVTDTWAPTSTIHG
jgi:hypothetical protein